MCALIRCHEVAPKLIDRFATEWVIVDEGATSVQQNSPRPDDAVVALRMPVSSKEVLRESVKQATTPEKRVGAA
jgi:hypothetical protein